MAMFINGMLLRYVDAMGLNNTIVIPCDFNSVEGRRQRKFIEENFKNFAEKRNWEIQNNFLVETNHFRKGLYDIVSIISPTKMERDIRKELNL